MRVHVMLDELDKIVGYTTEKCYKTMYHFLNVTHTEKNVTFKTKLYH
jgi:Cdc6-like AAA superfamily ATPase